KGSEAVSFPWSCAALNGVCRQGACLPSELYFGPLGCGKESLCCVSYFF
ncbi:beta-defensin-like 1 precursor, partial [Silurus meridionalis]